MVCFQVNWFCQDSSSKVVSPFLKLSNNIRERMHSRKMMGNKPLLRGRYTDIRILFYIFVSKYLRFCSNIEWTSSNNTYLNIIEILNKLFKKLNIIESRNLIRTSTLGKVLLFYSAIPRNALIACFSFFCLISFFPFILLALSCHDILMNEKKSRKQKD